MDEQMHNEVTQQVLDQLTGSASVNEAEAQQRREQAETYRRQADQQVKALRTHAADADANAERLEAAARIKRQIVAWWSGRQALPTPGEVLALGKLGMAIGALKMAPPPDASPAELESYRDLVQAVHEQALHQLELVRRQLREAQATISTGQLPEEDLPQPDPLTADPAEVSGSQGVSGEAEALPAGVEPLPQAEPDASAECGRPGCGYPLILLDGTWLHAVTLDAECRPGTDEYADPVNVVHRDPLPDAAAQQPSGKRVSAREATRKIRGSLRRKPAAEGRGESPYVRYVGQRVLIRTKAGESSRGVLYDAGLERLVLEPCEVGSASVLVADVEEVVFPVPVAREGAGVWRSSPDAQPNGYPDRPVHGPAAEGPVRSDPSALLLPSQGAGDATQALPTIDGGS